MQVASVPEMIERMPNCATSARRSGIMIGGLGVMVPERRHEVVALGMRSILSGTLATCMSGAVAGVLTG